MFLEVDTYIQVWVRGEEDPNPIKLQVTDRTDVADLLVEASGSGEFNYFVKNTKSYNLLCNNEILPRSSMVADDTLKSTAENPFIIVKAKKQEPDCMSIVLEYCVVKFIFRQPTTREIFGKTQWGT